MDTKSATISENTDQGRKVIILIPCSKAHEIGEYVEMVAYTESQGTA